MACCKHYRKVTNLKRYTAFACFVKLNSIKNQTESRIFAANEYSDHSTKNTPPAMMAMP